MKGALVALLVVAGCSIGTRPAHFRPAAGPAGVTTEIRTKGERLTGELLALDDTALVLRRLGGTQPVAFVRYSSIRASRFEQVGVSLSGRPPLAREREELRLVSRFPQGLNDDLLRKLLAAYAQAEPLVY